MELYPDVRTVLAPACHMDIFALVKSVDHRLLHLLIQLCVKRIDLDHFVKYFRIFFTDLRYGISHYREASFLSPDILIGQLPGPAVVLERQFPLLIGIGRRFEYCPG